MHFCADEVAALMSLVPGAAYAGKRLHAWWKSKTKHKCHEETQAHDGVEDPHVSESTFEKEGGTRPSPHAGDHHPHF